MKKRETLWMRYVDFEKVKDMLHLVFENNGSLTASRLEELGIKKEILIKRGSKNPLTHTPRYHYRKVMENLGLIKLENRFYYIVEDKKVLKFLELTKFRDKKFLSYEAKEILRQMIVDNKDCKKYFFNLFIYKPVYSIEDLRKEGNHVFVRTRSMDESFRKREEDKSYSHRKKSGPVILKNKIGKSIKLKTQDELHAVYWGVRLWSLDLEITNEIMRSFHEGRVIYPVNPNFSEKDLNILLLKRIMGEKNHSKWALLHIPTFIKEAALSTRFSIDRIKEYFRELKARYPTLVMFVPSSTVFIDIRTPYEKQDATIRNSYLYEEGKGYISHLRIRKDIQKEVEI